MTRVDKVRVTPPKGPTETFVNATYYIYETSAALRVTQKMDNGTQHVVSYAPGTWARAEVWAEDVE